MLDHVLEDLLKVEEADGDVEVLRRSMAPIRTLGKDAGILMRAASECGASSSLFEAAKEQVNQEHHHFPALRCCGVSRLSLLGAEVLSIGRCEVVHIYLQLYYAGVHKRGIQNMVVLPPPGNVDVANPATCAKS